MEQIKNDINPYQLLGLTPLSTLNFAKKQYYNMALLCHPDKGGASNDMITIHNAYNYVKKQLTYAHSKDGTTYQQLEDEFEEFCKQQETKPPTFASIYEEANDWIKDFNREFETRQKTEDYQPFKEGYGNLMDPSNVKDNYDENESNQVNHSFNKSIVQYEEPQFLPDFYCQCPLNKKKIDDFSCNIGKTNMTDYMKAYSPAEKVEIEVSEESIEKLYLQELEKRKLSN